MRALLAQEMIERSKFEHDFYRTCIPIVKSKNPKSNHHKLRTVCRKRNVLKTTFHCAKMSSKHFTYGRNQGGDKKEKLK